MEWLFLLVGLVIGGAAAWFLGRAQAKDSLDIVRQQIAQKDNEILELRRLYDAESRQHTAMEEQLKAAEKNLAEQKQFLEASRQQFENAFAALSRTALESNNTQFLQLATSTLETLLSEAKGDIGQKQQAIEALVRPLDEALKEYQKQTRALETNLKTDYGSLGEQLRTVTSTTQSLQKATDNLGTALRNPQVRGRWGELTLKRVAELSGMSDHCDFTEQVSIDTDEGRQRPDMIIHLPGGGQIVVDSKVSLEAYNLAVSAASDEERTVQLQRHAAQVKDHVRRLSAKSYWSQFPQAPNFVVMFIPGESFFAAAVDVDRALIEDAMRSNVILASPTTFIALLRTVAMGWRQEQIAKNAETIRRLGADLYERIARFIDHFAGIGRSLEQSIASYNKAVASLDTRLLVPARRLKELGTTAQADIPDVQQIDRLPRAVQADLAIGADDEPS